MFYDRRDVFYAGGGAGRGETAFYDKRDVFYSGNPCFMIAATCF